ncbi:phosphatidate cytidylyltransferase [Otariodibacter sp.]|uniref:phosphatidate cytidylyltransferase n=1 Tax=Otariodibacter sp. TaxID=3030919 RepID=UPI00262ADB42|nr:phosphatidate cytidylyltransferase [Otariodibacter sp.]
MLKERILSAIIMIVIAVVALFGLTPLPFTLALSAIVVLSMWEWAQFAGFKRPIVRAIVAFVTVGLLLFPIMAANNYVRAARFLTDESTPFLFLGCIWWIVSFVLVISYPKSANLWMKSISAKFIFGFCTLIPFLLGVLALRFYQYNTNNYQGAYLLLYVFVLVWGADSGAYFVGRKFGKHKLAPKVSPGKSVEGAIGGIITSGIIAFVFLQFAPLSILGREVSTLFFILLSVLTVVVSILGDLSESMFKRQASIKDSSNLIPGHGGILDRIDSLTAAVPVFATGFFFFL